MRNNAITVALMLATLSTASIVHAADQNLEKLSSVQAEIVLLQAENDREELIQKLKKLREPEPVPVVPEVKASVAPKSPYSDNTPASAPFPMPPSIFGQMQDTPPLQVEEKPKAKVEKETEVPTLRGVVGAGEKLFATVGYESGEEIEASVGDPLPGGFTVVSLTLSKLTLKDKAGKKIVILRSIAGERAPAKATESEIAPMLPPSATRINYIGGVR